MTEKNRESMRVSITLYSDTNQDIHALLCQTEKNRGEIIRRLLEFAINQFPDNTLSVQNILNGSFYYASQNQHLCNMTTSSNDNDGIDKDNVSKIASNINF